MDMVVFGANGRLAGWPTGRRADGPAGRRAGEGERATAEAMREPDRIADARKA